MLPPTELRHLWFLTVLSANISLFALMCPTKSPEKRSTQDDRVGTCNKIKTNIKQSRCVSNGWLMICSRVMHVFQFGDFFQLFSSPPTKSWIVHVLRQLIHVFQPGFSWIYPARGFPTPQNSNKYSNSLVSLNIDICRDCFSLLDTVSAFVSRFHFSAMTIAGPKCQGQISGA